MLNKEFRDALIINLITSILIWLISYLLEHASIKPNLYLMIFIFLGSGLFLIIPWFIIFKKRSIQNKIINLIINNLKLKYTINHKIIVVKNDYNFYHEIANALFNEIKIRDKNKEIKIGIICGPAVLKVIDYMAKSKSIKRYFHTEHERIKFVAMNKAADRIDYEYSANYLISQFKRIFKCKSAAYTPNICDKANIEEDQNEIGILLCSAGPIYGEDRSWLIKWIEYNNKYDSKFPLQPKDCVGDFCLTPINFTGRFSGSIELKNKIGEFIDPHPSFQSLGELTGIKLKNTMKIIFPINSDLLIADNGIKITQKELIADLVLRSNCIDTCIIGKELAENLINLLGWFLIDKISNITEKNIYRIANGYDFKTNNCNNNIIIYDPKNRLNNKFQIYDKENNTIDYKKEYPDIIFSEFNGEDNGFNFKTHSGFFEFAVEGDKYQINIPSENVRKPGQWTLATSFMMRSCIRQIYHNKKLRVLDMGCGCGAVGIFALLKCKSQIDKMFFIDIDHDSVVCTKNNILNFNLIDKCILINGDLFDEFNKNAKFDIIAMNPPFAPVDIANNSIRLDIDYNKTILKYCQNVGKYLNDGGIAILTIAEYADSPEIKSALMESCNINSSAAIVEIDRLILYTDSDNDELMNFLPHEVANKKNIEKSCKCLLKNYKFNEKEFIGFAMRHIVVKNGFQN
jgi:16S rRNA G966 N2-methylase RsmD